MLLTCEVVSQVSESRPGAPGVDRREKDGAPGLAGLVWARRFRDRAAGGWPSRTMVTFFSTTGVSGLSWPSRCTRAMALTTSTLGSSHWPKRCSAG
jgi:hypothetical protein